MANPRYILAGFIILALTACAQHTQKEKQKVAVIQTSMGRIVFKFYPEDAPKTCENFIKLANKGFYNGLLFHRVVKGHVIQAGCPKGDGSGGPGYTIKAEFNKQKHIPGAVGMAREQDPDSAGSQFYICLAPRPHLDGQYTIFGQVIEGMDVVLAIGDVGVEGNERPLKPVTIEKAYIEER